MNQEVHTDEKSSTPALNGSHEGKAGPISNARLASKFLRRNKSRLSGKGYFYSNPATCELEKYSVFPSRLQSRILAAIYYSSEGYVTTETVLRETGIAQSTWSEEQTRLIEGGLLEKKQTKVMSSKVITRIMQYKLTDKGKLVAHNLTNISRIMAPGQFLSKTPIQNGANDCTTMTSSDVNDAILECIEVGLESFGMNLDKLVMEEVEAAGLSWKEVAASPDKLVFHLVKLFGSAGALTIEQMIAANVKTRFDLRSISSNNLSSIVRELKVSAHRINLDRKL
jgi:predicted transcriptional regulator